MTVITQNLLRAGCYLGESAPLNMINEPITVLSGSGVVQAGTILGQVTDGGTQTVAAAVAAAGNTGTGTVGSLTADAGAPAGSYDLVCIEPATDAGKFEVLLPSGDLDGIATVGVAYNGTLNFTISDATDFVAGDRFTVAVSYASSAKYAPHDAAANDGREVAAAILYDKVDATSGDVKAVATVRGPATLFDPYLTYKSGISAGDKLAAQNALKARGMAILIDHS